MKYKKGTFTIVPLLDKLQGLPPEAQTIFMRICQYADDNGQCYPSRSRLAKQSGIRTLKTIDKYIDMLCDVGILQKTTRKKEGTKQNETNLYQIVLENEIPHLEYEIHGGRVSDTLGGSVSNDIGTIYNKNYNNITIVAEDQNDPPQTPEIESPKQEEKTLPLFLGKTKLLRIVKVWEIMFKNKFGNFPSVVPYAKIGGLLKPILDKYTEYQIVSLLTIHFSWHGTSGTDDFVYRALSNSGFSLTYFRKNVDLYIAYLTNSIGLVYNREDDVIRYVVKHTGKMINDYKNERGYK
ncbi:MAG TPA: helix-turn-helix domain-containing protein [Allocoleopsis sp.]